METDLKFTSAEDFEFLSSKPDQRGSVAASASNVNFIKQLRGSGEDNLGYYERAQYSMLKNFNLAPISHNEKKGSSENGDTTTRG